MNTTTPTLRPDTIILSGINITMQAEQQASQIITERIITAERLTSYFESGHALRVNMWAESRTMQILFISTTDNEILGELQIRFEEDNAIHVSQHVTARGDSQSRGLAMVIALGLGTDDTARCDLADIMDRLSHIYDNI